MFAGTALWLTTQQIVTEGGRPGERQGQRSDQGHPDRDCQRAEEDSIDAGDGDERQEHDDRRDGGTDEEERESPGWRDGMASARDCPASRCKTMFSTTTMASSITSPTAAARPPSVIRLKLCPRNRRAMKVTAMVAGITSPATSEVPQSRRNSTMMNEASTSPSRMASRTLLMDSVTNSD